MGYEKISKSYDCIVLECAVKSLTLLSLFECFHQAHIINFRQNVDWPVENHIGQAF